LHGPLPGGRRPSFWGRPSHALLDRKKPRPMPRELAACASALAASRSTARSPRGRRRAVLRRVLWLSWLLAVWMTTPKHAAVRPL
jgi:hypothetical protein